MPVKTIIALDLGATKCAGGIIEYQEDTLDFTCKKSCSVKLADTISLADMILKIESLLGITLPSADAVCIGAAGQYDGRELQHLPGVYPYPMQFADLAERHNWPPFAVIHDYDSVLCATFTSYMNNDDNLLRLNNAIPDAHKRRVVLGLGTGLGLKDGVLLQNGDFWLGKNEIGHIGIIHPPLANQVRQNTHQEFMRFLMAQQAHAHQQITFENILTGRGLVQLYQFLYSSQTSVSPEQAGEKMAAGRAPELLDLLAWYLGMFTGSVQLIFMPEGGAWITGGVAIKHLELFTHPAFQEGMWVSPAFQRERELYSLGVMKNEQHALIGAAFYAVKRLLPVTHRASSLQ